MAGCEGDSDDLLGSRGTCSQPFSGNIMHALATNAGITVFVGYSTSLSHHWAFSGLHGGCLCGTACIQVPAATTVLPADTSCARATLVALSATHHTKSSNMHSVSDLRTGGGSAAAPHGCNDALLLIGYQYSTMHVCVLCCRCLLSVLPSMMVS